MSPYAVADPIRSAASDWEVGAFQDDLSSEWPAFSRVLIAATSAPVPVTESGHEQPLRPGGVYASNYWLGGPGFFRPVAAHIEVDEDRSVIAQNPETGIFGVGSTLADAINDLREALVDHLHVLDEGDELSEDLAEQLKFLKVHLRAS